MTADISRKLDVVFSHFLNLHVSYRSSLTFVSSDWISKRAQLQENIKCEMALWLRNKHKIKTGRDVHALHPIQAHIWRLKTES